MQNPTLIKENKNAESDINERKQKCRMGKDEKLLVKIGKKRRKK